jgi:hypothetical protein
MVTGLLQVITRDGFDMRRHALSHLSHGTMGWVQVLNFLLTGVLVLAGAAGVRRTLVAGRGRAWGPLLLATYGIGLLGAGIFTADPAPDFPSGVTPGPPELSTSGLLHFGFGALGFYALIGACVVLGLRWRDEGATGWALWSVATGLVFFLAFGAIASGASAPAALLALYGAVALAWIWHSAIHARFLHQRHPL